MTTMSFDEIKALVVALANGEMRSSMPIGIITEDLDKIKKYLESVSGARRISNPFIAGAAKYFDGEGKLVENIGEMDQLLTDGTKCNAKKYLESRAADYAVETNKLLYDVCYVYTPTMAAVSEYVARKARKPLIMLLSPDFTGLQLIQCSDKAFLFKKHGNEEYEAAKAAIKTIDAKSTLDVLWGDYILEDCGQAIDDYDYIRFRINRDRIVMEDYSRQRGSVEPVEQSRLIIEGIDDIAKLVCALDVNIGDTDEILGNLFDALVAYGNDNDVESSRGFINLLEDKDIEYRKD